MPAPAATSSGTDAWPENRTSSGLAPSRSATCASTPTASAAAEQQRRHPETETADAVHQPPDREQQRRRHHPDHDRHHEIEHVGALVGREVRDREARGAEAAPIAEADEDRVADRRGHETGQQHPEQRRAHRQPALQQQHPGHERAAEQRRHRRHRARQREHGQRPVVRPRQPRRRHAGHRPERDHRRLGAEDGAEGERAERREGDPGRMADRRRLRAQAFDRRMPAVTRQQPARGEDEQRAGHRQPDHEVRGRPVVAELGREIGPQPVLELVDERRGNPRRAAPRGCRRRRRSGRGGGRRRRTAPSWARAGSSRFGHPGASVRTCWD